MTKENLDEQSPRDPREVMRASCMRSGRVPPLVKNAKVWVWFFGEWRFCTVRRKMPGDVYLCELGAPVEGSRTVVVSANTFGGF